MKSTGRFWNLLFLDLVLVFLLTILAVGQERHSLCSGFVVERHTHHNHYRPPPRQQEHKTGKTDRPTEQRLSPVFTVALWSAQWSGHATTTVGHRENNELARRLPGGYVELVSFRPRTFNGFRKSRTRNERPPPRPPDASILDHEPSRVGLLFPRLF
jgi:hypothetical protein